MESNGKNNSDPIRAHTSQAVQQRIDSTLEERIRYYASQPTETITRRIEDLEREWDIDRMMTANAAGLALSGVLLGFFGRGKRWLLLSGTVLAYLLMHGLRGWSPPATGLRRFGLRTRAEIDAERYALKLLRGDFEAIRKQQSQSQQYPAGEVWSAVRT